MVVTRNAEMPSIRNDPFNNSNCRNVHNTRKYEYNCGGYALNCFSWYCPNRGGYSHHSFYDFDTEQEARARTLEAVDTMLEEFPDLRMVDSLNEVQADEYAILFRLSSMGDFHFLKRGRDHKWRHKMGARSKIYTMKTADIFDIWYGDTIEYDGPIAILAKKF